MPAGLPKKLLENFPVRIGAGVLGDQFPDPGPKRLLTDLAPEHVKDHCGFLVADGVVPLGLLGPEPTNRIVLLRSDIDRIPDEHHAALFPSLLRPAHEFVVVIVREIRGQPFHPVAILDIVQDRVADPGMHDLMAEGIGLHVSPFHNPASQQRKRRHAESAREEIFHKRELRKRIGPEQLRINPQVPDCRPQILVGEVRILRKQVRCDFNPVPGALLSHKAVRNQRERLGLRQDIPMRPRMPILGDSADFPPMGDPVPTLRRRDLHAEGRA